MRTPVSNSHGAETARVTKDLLTSAVKTPNRVRAPNMRRVENRPSGPTVDTVLECWKKHGNFWILGSLSTVPVRNKEDLYDPFSNSLKTAKWTKVTRS